MLPILQAPHRIFFALGALLSLIPVIWWVGSQGSLFGDAFSSSVYLPGAHMYFMTYGVLSAFILGFILTVFPKWLNFAAYSLKHVYALTLLFVSSYVLSMYGVLYDTQIHGIGTILNALGFVYLVALLSKSFISVQHPGKMQPGFTLLGIIAGAIGSICYVLFMFQKQFVYYELSYAIGLYFYLFVVVASVAFRMVPFFTSCVVDGYTMDRVPWFLPMVTIGSFLKVILFMMHLSKFYLLADGFILVAVVFQFKRWKFKLNHGIPLLSMLYYSMIWMPISLVLFCVYSIITLNTGVPNVYIEEAALHALTIGCYSSLVYAMATRVTLGHSGQKLISPIFINIVFYVFQLCAISRVGMGLMAYTKPDLALKSYMSGYIWILCFGIWFLKYFPVYFMKRFDGKEG